MTTEQNQTTKAHCNECNRETHQTILARASRSDSEVYGSPQEPDIIQWGDEYKAVQCNGCHCVSLIQESWFSEEEGTSVTQYPPPSARKLPQWHDQLPGELYFLLTEVYAAMHADSRVLSAIGARLIFERIATDKLQDGTLTFDKMLEGMKQAEMLSAEEVSLLKPIVEAGHAAVHRGYRPSSKHLGTILDVIEHLLARVYVFPSRVTELEAVVPSKPLKKKPSNK